MKTKTIPFDLETAKKIQAGGIEGRIKTREGQDARIICWDRNYVNYPLVVLITKDNGRERLCDMTSNGRLCCDYSCEFCEDLILEVPYNEPQFKPFDKVLVRDFETTTWQCSFYSHKEDKFYFAGGISWNMCIPYEGNQELVGTTDKPKEE